MPNGLRYASDLRNFIVGLALEIVTVAVIERACWKALEAEIRTISSPGSILTFNHQLRHRTDYGNDNGYGNDFQSGLRRQQVRLWEP